MLFSALHLCGEIASLRAMSEQAAKILIHTGELFLKGKNRKVFERKLVANLKHLFKPTHILRQQGRMLLDFDVLTEDLLEHLSLTPGVRNFAVVHECDTSLDAIRETSIKAIHAAFGAQVAGKRFRVDARRSDKSYPLTSPQLNFEVGGFLKNQLDLHVSLDHPEITVHVEVTHDQAYVYTDKLRGVGGLPVGTSGKGVVLFSGGIDSPVAAYTMMKRGMEVVLVHCYNSTINRDFAKIRDLARRLARYQGRIVLHMVDLEEYQRHAIAMVPADYRMILYKRQMIREAAKIAAQEKAQALVTGDSLGQVASQTLANIHAIYDASTLPLLPPLIGNDKEEIIEIGRKIGTFEISIEEYCDICSFLIAKHPQTRVDKGEVARFETLLPIEQLVSPVRTEIFYSSPKAEPKE